MHIEVFKSSNNSKFDNEAIETIKYVVQLKHLPNEFNGQDIEVIITFKK